MFAIEDGKIWCTLPMNARVVSVEEARQIISSLQLYIPIAEAAQQSVNSTASGDTSPVGLGYYPDGEPVDPSKIGGG